MDATTALQQIKAATQWHWSDHALDRMDERDVFKADIKHVVAHATTCRPSDTNPGAWLVSGPDRTDEPLTVSIAIEQPLTGAVRNVVVTVMDT